MASGQNWQGCPESCFSCEHVQSQLVEDTPQRSLQGRNKDTEKLTYAHTTVHLSRNAHLHPLAHKYNACMRMHAHTHACTHAHTHKTHTNASPNNLVATPPFTTAMGPPPAVSTACTGSSMVGTLPGDIAGCVVTMVTGIAPAGKRVGGTGSKPPNQ